MSAIDRLRCRLGIHDWRSGICFSCWKKADSSGVGGSRKASASPARVPPARVDETQAPAGRAAPPLSPPPAAPLSASSTSNEAAASQWHVGEVILDLYEVKEVFESGGMGLVHRVHHRGWNTDLAVKSPRAEQFRTDGQRRRFEAEIETWIGLGLHPHIVSCYYVRTLGGVPRVFAEYVAGGTLDAWIKDRRLYAGGRAAAQERLLDVALQIAWAMGYAHTQGAGLVHQDLKPLNVLMTPEGTAKVTDFGLAQARGRSGAADSAAGDGRTVYVDGRGWTLPYASPEQHTGARLSRKTDIWSWAVLVLEMYLGGLPWEPKTPGHVALAHGLEGYLQSGAADPAIPPLPPALQGLLRECLKPNPAERSADFGAVAARLRGIYRETVGQDYPRVQPSPAQLQADALSNRAISMLDLGRESEAQALFEQALAQEPGHPQATYNWGLVRWRSGEITDLDLEQQLEQAQANRPGDWVPPYLLGLVHLERRDAAGARAVLMVAQELADRPEIRSALALAKQFSASAGNRLSTLTGHTDNVTAVALSGDGRWALSGSWDSTLRLWDLGRGKCVRILRGHERIVTSLALSADGHRALSSSQDYTLRLWNLNTGECRRTLATNLPAESVALSGDGRRAISGGWSGALCVWDLDTGQWIKDLTGHHACDVTAVALSADGRRALSGSADKTLRFWNLDLGKRPLTLTGHTERVVAVALSADGCRGLSGSEDHTLRWWDLNTGDCLRTLKGHNAPVESVALSGDGRWALSGSWDRTLRLWDLVNGRCLCTMRGHTGFVTAVALSADGRRALSGSKDLTLRLWDLGASREKAPALGVPLVLSAVADAIALLSVQRRCRALLSQADAALATGQWADAWRLANQAGALPGYGFDPEVRQRAQEAGWRGGVRRGLRGVRCLATLAGHTDLLTSVALSADGRRVLSGSVDRTLRLWDLDTGLCLKTLAEHTDAVTAVALSSDGRRALSGSADKTLRFWDLDRGECLRTIQGHASRVTSAALSADGCRALSGGEDYSLCLWDLATGDCLRTCRTPTNWVSSAVLSADGRRALSGGADNAPCLWDLETGECLRILVGRTSLASHTSWVTAVALSADGCRALSGSVDRTLRLWDLDRGKCLRTLKGHSDTVWSVALSDDGRCALSGAGDQTLRLWDLDTGKCLRLLGGHSGRAGSTALSADGRWALSVSGDQALLWELDWDYGFPKLQDWDEGARPYLRNFLAQHAPAPAGHPTSDDAAWQELQQSLCDAGFGWLRPEGVRRELNRMAERWQSEQ